MFYISNHRLLEFCYLFFFSLYPNVRLVHIPGRGDFQIDKILTAQEPVKGSWSRKDDDMFEEKVVDAATDERQELDTENIPDVMEGEQTWPTHEELAEAEKQNMITKMKKVPRGTSDYQAAWIVDNDVDEDDLEDEEEEDEDEDDDMDEVDAEEEEESDEGEEHEPNYDTESVAMTEDMDYDTRHVNFAAEVDEMEKLKAARLEAMFPDEVDTPMDVAARIRFQKYRGLKSFRTSVWDPKENLPYDYARIWQFENFDRTKKRVLSEKEVTGKYHIQSNHLYFLYQSNLCVSSH